ncbi:MAG: phosphoglycerate kinase [Candidatus Spechtbacterales bacterium]
MRTLSDIDVRGKAVLLRVDFNVDVEGGVVADDFRIRAALPTIYYLRERDARVLVLAHLGRPKGAFDPALSLRPVAQHLGKLLKTQVHFFATMQEARRGMQALHDGEIGMLENLRFHAGEEEGSAEFAKELAALGEVYVNDAFGVAHRKHASVYELPKLLPSAAGLLLEKEVSTFQGLRESPQQPLVFILGGAKVATKIKVVGKLVGGVSAVCFGGLIANSFLAAKGVTMGKSLYEKGITEYIKGISVTDVNIHLPLDVVVSTDMEGKAPTRVTGVGEVGEGEFILDIGPDTVALFASVMREAGTVFWNGPMGLFEVKAFSRGTYEIARALRDVPGKVIVGGGDVMRAIDEVGVADTVDYSSTGGGAMLEFLAEGTLPGIEVLE